MLFGRSCRRKKKYNVVIVVTVVPRRRAPLVGSPFYTVLSVLFQRGNSRLDNVFTAERRRLFHTFCFARLALFC